MITELKSCTQCGKSLRSSVAGLQTVCPSCLLRAVQTPRTADSSEATVSSSTDTTWADVFPQFRIERTLRASAETPVYLAVVEDEEPVRRAIVQIVTGEVLLTAGGVPALMDYARSLVASPIDGLLPILDFGDLCNSFYLATEAPDLPLLADELGRADAGASAAVLETFDRESRRLGLDEEESGLELHVDPSLAFVAPDLGSLRFTPSALPPGAAFAGPRGGSEQKSELAAGARIASFELQEKLGEGGFGEVWRARQQFPVDRQVALKVLKDGLHSSRARARFDLEQAALARLDHPHIARLFEAGFTPDGRPFFAMEWVDGETLGRYAREEKIPLAQRLAVFTQVCEAVQHAHQKGILHRDLKPSNVMVAEEEDVPVAKVIDFGVARTAEEPAADRSLLLTRPHDLMGTPVYMSPEQLENTAEADARADVYSLGVTLYELLCGELPFDPKCSLPDLQRAIRDEVPVRPSLRLSDRERARALRGDLDWITLKCLEKDPARRYPSVSALLEDLARHAANEPVEAGPPEWSYRVGKFWRRNRGLIVSAGMIAATLIAATVTSVVQARRADRESVLAREAERAADERRVEAEEQRVEAEENRKAAEAVVDFFGDIFASNNPWKEGRNATVDEALTRAAQKLERDKSITDEWRVQILNSLASSFWGLGMPDKSIPLSEEAVALAEAHLGRLHHGTITVLENLGLYLGDAGRIEDAIAVQEEAIARETEVDADYMQRWDVARANLAGSYMDAGRHAEAREILEQLLETVPEASQNSAYAKAGLARALAKLGERDRAILILERLLTREPGAQVEGMRMSWEKTLAVNYLKAGEPESAARSLEDLLPRYVERWGLQHFDVAQLYLVLGNAYEDLGQHTRSINLYRGLLRDYEEFAHVEGDNYDLQKKLLIASGNLGTSLSRAGRYRDAIAILDPLRRRMEGTEGVGRESRFAVESTLAEAYLNLGEFAQAAAIYEGMLPKYEFGSDLNSDVSLLIKYPLCYSRCGQPEKAIEIRRTLIASGTRAYGAENRWVHLSVHHLARDLIRAGQAGEAAELLEDLLAEVPQGATVPWRPDVMRSLASAYRELGRREEETQMRAERRAETSTRLETAYSEAVTDQERSAEVLVPVGSSWRWNLPAEAERASVAARFSDPDFDASAWEEAPGSLLGGFGIEGHRNQWMDAVKLADPDSPEAHGHGPAFIRHRFTTNEAHQHLELLAQFADGVVVFLDGMEVARRNVHEGKMVANLRASNYRIGFPAWTPLPIPLKGRLEPGEHVLSISLHGHPFKHDRRLAGIQLLSWSGPAPDPPLADELLAEPMPGPFDADAFTNMMHGLSLRELRQGHQARASEALALSMIGHLLAEEDNWAASASALMDRYEEWRALTVDEDARTARSTLLERGAGWKFHACNEATAAPGGWTSTGFDDSSWKSGAAPLGYGDPAVAGEVATGEEPDGKPRTVLFRRTLAVESGDPFGMVLGRLRADDGAAVYVNGQEVQRLRLPEGVLEPSVFATKGVAGDAEAKYAHFTIPAHVLKPGENLIAVEVHQVTAKSSDVIFDFELQGIRIEEFLAVLDTIEPDEALDKIRRTYQLSIQNLPPDWREQVEARLRSIGG